MKPIEDKQSFSPIYQFLFYTFLFSSLFYFLIIQSGRIETASYRYDFGLMWAPGIAALICCKIRYNNYKIIGWKWGDTSFQLMSYYTPLIYCSFTYLLIWLFGFGGFPNPDFVRTAAKSFGWSHYYPPFVIVWQFILVGTAGVIKGFGNTLGEELGWRGYFTPQLYRVASYTRTSLIIGLVWSFWHFPILLFSNYNTGGNLIFSLVCFTVMQTSLNFMYTWLRIKSGSVWTGVILHSSHNMFIQAFFTPATLVNSKTHLWYDEFGLMLMVFSIIAGIYFWSRRNELELPESNTLNNES